MEYGTSKFNLEEIHKQQLLLKLLGSVQLFDGFAQKDLLEFLACSSKCCYEQNKFILNEGDEGECMFVITSGTVEISRKTKSGNKKLAELNPGDCFGELALVAKGPRSASVRAATDCVLLRVCNGSLAERNGFRAKIYHNIAHLLALRLRDTDAMISLML